MALQKLMENELKDCPTKIDGERAEGLPYKIGREHVAGLSLKTEVKNELWDSHMLVETAVAG